MRLFIIVNSVLKDDSAIANCFILSIRGTVKILRGEMNIYLDFTFRIGAAFLCGALIGLERETSGQPAGIRTHIVLAVGAALAMYISRTAADGIADQTRMAAQVISGIGFLGAGAIIRYGANIKGLTTATGLWTVAIIGLLCGDALFWQAMSTTVVIVVVLSIIGRIEHRLPFVKYIKRLSIVGDDRENLVSEILAALKNSQKRYENISLKTNKTRKTLEFRVDIKIQENRDIVELERIISSIEGVISCEIQ